MIEQLVFAEYAVDVLSAGSPPSIDHVALIVTLDEERAIRQQLRSVGVHDLVKKLYETLAA